MDVLQGIADGFKSIFFASDGDVTSQKNTEIGEVSLDELPDDVQNQYDVYEHDNWETKTEDLSGRTKAGDEYKNRSKTLPETTADGDAITYKEYDAYRNFLRKAELYDVKKYICENNSNGEWHRERIC